MKILVHVIGLFAIFLVAYHCNGNRNLGASWGVSNTTATALHETLEFLDGVSSSVPIFRGVAPAVIVINLVAVMYGLFLARKLYHSVFGSFELYCPNTKTGFVFPRKEISDGLVSKQEVVNDVRRRRKWGDIPPPFPNGWFALLRSKELKPGGSTSINAMGQNFAIFRDKGGKIYIVDAYCPHLGANLGVGGQVIGNCIECPFHGWQFDGETGECSKIPYSNGKIPPQAKVKVWPSLEINGFILVWYDAEGRDPFWFPEEMTDIKTRGMQYRGCSTHFVNAHIEDIPENGADVSHLTYLHGAGVASGSDVNFKDLLSGKLHGHSWTANWEALAAQHAGRLTLTMSNIILGFKIQSLDITSQADQIGPGIVYLTLKSSFGRVLLLHSLTPQEPFLQKYCLIAYSDWWIPSFVIKKLVQGYDVQLERDMIVWNNKRYNLKPLLVREDELIRKHRRWYSQFYSENSQKFSFQKNDLTF